MENILDKIMDSLNEFKIESFKQYNNLLKWIYRLVNHAIQEKEYKNKKTKFLSYPRGSIVKVDFGFNVGYELGGVHYAIVITKKDSIHSGLLTVIPLTSKKPHKKINHSEIDLGDEFNQIVSHKSESTERTMKIYRNNYDHIQQELDLFYEEFGHNTCCIDEVFRQKFSAMSIFLLPDSKSQTISYSQLQKKFNDITEFHEFNIQSHIKLKEELSYMKEGTIAKVDQLTTISKSRIINPLKPHHALHKLRFSNETLDKLNEKIKALFLFDK